MVNAIILLNCARAHITDVADVLAGMPEISEVYSVAGRYDLAAIIRVADAESLADVVTGKLLKVDGITASETLTAFRVYSRHDLEAMFNIGA